MKNLVKVLLSIYSVFLLVGTAQAEISILAARIGAVDVPALAEFYKSAFELKEVNRLDMAEGQVEIMLNFGETVDAAVANTNAQVVIMHRESDDFEDPIPHLIFSVSDIEAAAAAVTKAGGSLQSGPFVFGDTGIKLAFAKDPAGNQIELFQSP